MNKNIMTIAIVLLIAFISLTFFVLTGRTFDFDIRVSETINTLEQDGFTSFLKLLSFIGSSIPVIIIAILLMILFFIFYRSWRPIFIIAFSLLFSVGTNVVLKNIFQRERPSIIQLVTESGFSYPSGHSMIAFTLYSTLIYILWIYVSNRKNRLVIFGLGSLMILSIGFSRIYLGAHYFTDVIGAYMISGFILTVVMMIDRTYLRK